MTLYSIFIEFDDRDKVVYYDLEREKMKSIFSELKKDYSLTVYKEFYFDTRDLWHIRVNARRYTDFLSGDY